MGTKRVHADAEPYIHEGLPSFRIEAAGKKIRIVQPSDSGDVGKRYDAFQAVEIVPHQIGFLIEGLCAAKAAIVSGSVT